MNVDPSRYEDWGCPECDTSNFPSRRDCRQCSTPKPVANAAGGNFDSRSSGNNGGSVTPRYGSPRGYGDTPGHSISNNGDALGHGNSGSWGGSQPLSDFGDDNFNTGGDDGHQPNAAYAAQQPTMPDAQNTGSYGSSSSAPAAPHSPHLATATQSGQSGGLPTEIYQAALAQVVVDGIAITVQSETQKWSGLGTKGRGRREKKILEAFARRGGGSRAAPAPPPSQAALAVVSLLDSDDDEQQPPPATTRAAQ